MGKFTPQDIQELLKDLMPAAQFVSKLPDIKKCTDKQLVVVQDKSGISIYMVASGVFTLLTSSSGLSVTSVFGRKGNIVAEKGDYTSEMISTDEFNRFVTDAQISSWTASTLLRNQSGSVSVTSGVSKTITFDNVFNSTPIVICTLSGADDSAVTINPAHITRSISQFTVPALDIIQDGTIYWTASI